MKALPRLTEADVAAYVNDPYFERGKNYYQNGNIFDMVRRGQQIEGYCEGSAVEPYRVIVTFNQKGIAGDSCSCPMSGGCKHVAALLLTWAHKPKSFVKREPIATMLDEKSKEELAALIQEILEREPELEHLVNMPRPSLTQKRRTKVSPDSYGRQVRHAMFSAEDWHGIRDAAHEIGAVVDIGDKFAEQEDWENAQTVYAAILDEALPEYLNTHDEGDIGGELQRAVEGLTKCLAARVADASARSELCRLLFNVIEWDIEEAGGIDMGYGATEALETYAAPEDRREIRRRITTAMKKSNSDSWSSNYHREVWGRLLAAFTDNDDEFLKQTRKLGAYRPLFEKLLKLNRVDEALEVARKHLATSGWDVLQSAEALDAVKQTPAAMTLVETHLARFNDERLPEWLAGQYARRGQPQKALDLQLARWQNRPDLDLYKIIAKLAKQLTRWQTIRPELLATLTKPQGVALLVEIHLYEKNWSEAWRAAETSQAAGPWYGPSLTLTVALATEKHFPEKAIPVYLSEAEHLIGQRTRPSYGEAAKFLRRARDLLTANNQSAEWQSHLADLRQRYRNLPALQDELKKARL